MNLPALPVDEVIEFPSGGHLDDGECVNERERVCAGGKECVQERETVCAGEGESVYVGAWTSIFTYKPKFTPQKNNDHSFTLYL